MRQTFSFFLLFVLSGFLVTSCAQPRPKEANSKTKPSIQQNAKDLSKMEQATLGAGCFWCIEAVFQRLVGVESVVSGYSNGHVKTPTYKEVCSGRTGHAEVARITFDPTVISFAQILDVFWATHDPTTLNRQGNDRGTQYRSGIYYHSEEQKRIAEESKKKAQADFKDPIVTEIVAIDNFSEAEDYHQNYFNENPNQPYCSFVIGPKIEKFRKLFKDQVKDEYK